MLSKLCTCSTVNTASVKTLTTCKHRKRSVLKSWHYFFFLNRELRRATIILCERLNIKLIHNEISIFFAKNRYIAIFDQNTFIFVIFSSMYACSKIFKSLRVELYLWKDRTISSILDEISIVFFLKEKILKKRNES